MSSLPKWFKDIYDEIHQAGVVNHVAHLEKHPTIPYDIGTLMRLHNIVFKLASGDRKAFTTTSMDDSEDYTKSPSTLFLEALNDDLISVIQETHVEHLNNASKQDDITFLRTWNQVWQNFRAFSSGIRIIFYYLDTNYIREAPTILERCYGRFFTDVFLPYSNRLFNVITAKVREHRDGASVDATLLRTAVQSVVLLGQELRDYKETTERSLELYRNLSAIILSDMRAHYEQVIPQRVTQYDYGEYVSAVKKVFDVELDERVNVYLHSDTYEPVKDVLHDIALKKLLDSLLSRIGAMDYFFAPQHGDKLALLYFLTSTDAHSVDILAARLKSHLSATGSSIIDAHAAKVAAAEAAAKAAAASAEAASPTASDASAAAAAAEVPEVSSSALIESLVELNNSYEGTILQHCGNNAILRRALNEAFQSFINKDRQVSIHLAHYAHALMSVRGEHGVVSATRSRQSALASLFEYVREKDVFQRIYTELLAKRLLEDNSRGQQEERVLAEELNQRQATSEWLEGVKTMLSDIDESKSFTETVRTQRESLLNSYGLTVELTVCTDQLWPQVSTVVTKMNGLPASLRELTMEATNIYKHSSQRGYAQRQLSWQLDKGSADVRVTFANGTAKTLTVTTIMMMILSILDNIEGNAKFLTWDAVLDKMGYKVSDKEARVIMQHALGLADPKYGIIQKSNSKDTTTIAEKEKLMIAKQCNPIHARSQRIFIPVKELITAEDVAKREVEINKNRQILLEAAIVRIMKARKTMSNADLQLEVMSQMSQFKPDTATYKLALESMLSQDYITRDENDRNLLQYLA